MNTIDEHLILEIMEPRFKTSLENGVKKYENKNFTVIKKQNTTLFIDKRSKPYKIYSNLKLAYSILKKQT